VCSNDLALAVSRFCTSASASASLVVTIGSCYTCSVCENNCCTEICDW